MVSQFISPDKVRLLGELDFKFPEGTHAIGRLDNNSEGLLLLTTNKKITKLLFESEKPHNRTYLLQVEKEISDPTIQKLKQGVEIRVKKGEFYTTKPCAVEKTIKPIALPPREHEFASYLPQSWLIMSLTEGKFHQVRKMTAAVGHPCKRLIRVAIENIELGDMQPGEVRELSEDEFFNRLNFTD